MKFLARSLTLLALLTFNVTAQEAEIEPKKEGLDYLVVNMTLIDFNSIGSKYTAKNWATSLTMGTYITNYVKTEMRFGVGLTDDTVPGYQVDRSGSTPVITQSDATMTMNHFVSWYMGLHYPLAEWSSIYGQIGMSYVNADVTAEPKSTWEDLPSTYPGSKFSMSWIAGFDFEIVEDWYVTAEAGRLHRSSASDIQTLQYGLGLKYEF